MMKHQIVKELHKPARKNFIRRSVILKDIDDLWQADLIDMQSYKNCNRGMKYILVVIDCFSKYAWAMPIKSKSKSDVVLAFKHIIKTSMRNPLNLQTDNGTEFYNEDFKKLMKSFNINHYSTYSVKKASIVERLIRTIKNKLYKCFSLNGNYEWIGKTLNDVIWIYNNSKHRTIKFKPVEVNEQNKYEVMRNIQNSHKCTTKKRIVKLKVGDKVRISKYKSCFAKGYTPNWSTEIFIIKKVIDSNPPTFHLEDVHKQPILGSFYQEELQKVKFSNIYLVEKIIRRKGNKLLVKWLGLTDAENSWIDKKDVV